MTAPAARPPLTVVVLAAGEGTRMKSPARPKVLHGFAGRSLLGHALAAVAPLQPDTTAVVIGHRRDEVQAHLTEIAPDAVAVVQDQQNGTGHAVRTALDATGVNQGTVLVLPGDAPLLTANTLARLLDQHAETGGAATVLTSVVPDPTGYGRVIRDEDHPERVSRIVEHKDASPAELQIAEVSALVYAFDAERLDDAVRRLSTDNSQGEEYLPEVVSIFVAEGRTVTAQLAPAFETAGVNDRVQLAAAHRSYNLRLLEEHMRAGVTVIDPGTTWIDAGVVLEPDVTIHPNVQLHGPTRIAAGAEIGPNCTLTDTEVGADSRLTHVVATEARVGAGVTVGPYAYLRRGTDLSDQVHIGTFVELKAAEVGVGTKVPHLSYVGDATLGEHTNIGAASVFVNYDGVNKHRSSIGNHVRTGADNMFVAPVHVGDGAYTAAGSVIASDVPPGALGVARGYQRNVAGWVLRRRAGTPAAEAAKAAGAQESPPSTEAQPTEAQPTEAQPTEDSGSNQA